MLSSIKSVLRTASVPAAILFGMLIREMAQQPAAAQNTRGTQPPAAFLSGGERSALILERIERQLAVMDRRLAVIEAGAVASLSAQVPGTPNDMPQNRPASDRPGGRVTPPLPRSGDGGRP